MMVRLLPITNATIVSEFGTATQHDLLDFYFEIGQPTRAAVKTAPAIPHADEIKLGLLRAR